MQFFSATLNGGTSLSNVGYRFYDAAGPLAARQTSGLTQPVSGRPIFALTCNVPAGARLLIIDDAADAANYAHLALTFARGDELGDLTDPRLGTGQVTVVSPLSADGLQLTLARGDDYLAADSRALTFTNETWPDLTGATVALHFGTLLSIEATVQSAHSVRAELLSTETAQLSAKIYLFALRATLAGGALITLARGEAQILTVAAGV